MWEIYEKARKPIWYKFLKKAGWHGTQTLHWKRPLFSRDRQGVAGASVEVTGISPHGFYFLSVVSRRKVRGRFGVFQGNEKTFGHRMTEGGCRQR